MLRRERGMAAAAAATTTNGYFCPTLGLVVVVWVGWIVATAVSFPVAPTRIVPFHARRNQPCLFGTAPTKVGIIDGAEWISLTKTLQLPSAPFGAVRAVVYDDDNNKNYVALQAPDGQGEERNGVWVFPHTIAQLPDSKQLSNNEVLATALQLVSILSCVPKISNVGGAANQSSAVSGKVVIVGRSTPTAVLATRAYLQLGCQVVLVSCHNGRPKGVPPHDNLELVQANKVDRGFCDHIGRFDVMLDTIGNEMDSNRPTLLSDSTVIRLLREQHDCPVYASTCSHTQRIIENQGVLLGGPKQAEQYVNGFNAQFASQTVGSGPSWSVAANLPAEFGAHLQSIFSAGITAPLPKNFEKQPIYIKPWSLEGFWEETTWPRDASGLNVRFGLPVMVEDDDEDDDEELLSAPPLRRLTFLDDADPNQEEEVDEDNVDDKEDEVNPYVLKVVGVDEFDRQLVQPELDAVVFLSAPFCRTCRYLRPQYQRMAREALASNNSGASTDNDQKLVQFATADASGKQGKALGHRLGINAVPAFILLRNGKRYGDVLSLTRLPSPKLDLAIQYLRAGQEWDRHVFAELEDNNEGGKNKAKAPSSRKKSQR